MGGPSPSYPVRPLEDRRERPWGFLGLIGLVLALAVALLVGPGLLAPGPSAQPSVAPSSDPHVVVTGTLGTFAIAFDYAGQAFVVSRTVGSSTIELVRQPLPADQPQLPSGAPIFGVSEWSAACPGLTGGEPIRILFGSMYPPNDPVYRGPAAAWTIAEDGLFVIVLEPGHVDPGAEIRLGTASGSIGVDARAFDYALNSGASQSSGCFVA
ncbi:MAG: hypothetical protein HY263_06005 [Chloroflexi bacterium]|nr:hypothetical protein [Chloroflexota bacterium]